MNKKLQLPILALMVMFSTLLSGQKILHKANKQFDLKHYQEAIDSYKKTLEKYPDILEAKSNLAEAYRMTNQLSLAEDVYASIMSEENLDPILIRNFGITLMKMAKYSQAHYQFELYKVYNPQDAQHYQLSCEFAHHLYRQNKAFEVELVDVNTPNSDFGVAFLGDELVFSSFRNDVELSENAKKGGQELSGNMLYIADLDKNLKTSNVKFLRSGITEKKNVGPISFAEKGNVCAFTRNKIQNGGAHVTGDDSYHSIYVADLLPNGDWNKERPFRYNEFGTSTGFPSLAFDGSALYFASNRVGGFGGYDIYVSYWKENTWTYPENLGSSINTPGNEITPFFNGNEIYFASDYHHGMGGYDIFHSLVKGGEWTHPENMANGVNSPADDYYPVIKQGTEGIFFSSNRLGGRGMDDIYLAIPVEMPDFADAGFVPQAVELTNINSEIEAYAANPLAKPVSNNSTTEVKIINPAIVEKKPKKEMPIVVIDENEELPTWGFAKPGEQHVLQHEPRKKFTTAKIYKSTTIAAVASTLQQPNIKSPSISIPIIVDTIDTDDWADIDEETTSPEAVANTIIDETISEYVPMTGTENETEEVVLAEEKPESYKIPNYKAISASRAPLNLDLAGAKRVALGEILPASNVFFIQLAALSRSSGNVDRYKSLSKFGNLYKVFNTSTTKIKLGYFLDRSEAKNVLKSVKQFGFKDAFVTKDDLSVLQLELIIANETQSTDYDSYSSHSKSSSTTSTYNTSSAPTNDFSLNNRTKSNSYKIRLASYEDPIWFDIDKAKQLGRVEQWTKGSWTIFILGGYPTFNEAEAARIRAVNKGFADAEVVIDNNGILERLKQN